jgi:hypothetical protein
MLPWAKVLSDIPENAIQKMTIRAICSFINFVFSSGSYLLPL